MSTTLIIVASATPASILGALALWLPAKWARDDAADYRSEADRTFDAATSLADEVERTRNLPWYWPTGPAIEPAPVEPEPEVAADDAVTGELLAVDGVDTETDAPHEDTDRPGMWRVLLGLGSDLVDRAHDWLPNMLAARRERNLVGSGEQATDVDPFAELMADSEPAFTLAEQRVWVGVTDEQPPEVEERALLDTAWTDANPPANPTYKSHRCPSGAISSGDRGYQSRHTHPDFATGVFPVINPSIPAQRTDGDL